MTTDPTPLQERIKRALWEALPDVPEEDYGSVEPWLDRDAAAVLPIIAAEVQAAKAEAWDEGYLDRSPYGGRARSRRDNPYRAAETGDRA